MTSPSGRTQPGRIPKAPTRRELRAHPAVRNYTLFCLTALFLQVVCLADRGLEWWCLMPALIGGVSLLAHWSIGPPLLLLSLIGLLLSQARFRWSSPYWARDRVPTMMDLILCAAVLAYVMGHYRLLSLMRYIFPPDPRRSPLPYPPQDGGGRGGADPAKRRSADLVSGWEMALLVLALPLWTVLSVAAWGLLMADTAPLGMAREVWRTLWIVWVGLAVVAATGAVAGYLRQTLATPEESLLYLQDQLWRQTRREPGSLNRWLRWGRLRAQRRRETS
jgi:hypothetical protein